MLSFDALSSLLIRIHEYFFLDFPSPETLTLGYSTICHAKVLWYFRGNRRSLYILDYNTQVLCTRPQSSGFSTFRSLGSFEKPVPETSLQDADHSLQVSQRGKSWMSRCLPMLKERRLRPIVCTKLQSIIIRNAIRAKSRVGPCFHLDLPVHFLTLDQGALTSGTRKLEPPGVGLMLVGRGRSRPAGQYCHSGTSSLYIYSKHVSI